LGSAHYEAAIAAAHRAAGQRRVWRNSLQHRQMSHTGPSPPRTLACSEGVS
jgi:hypothetical protein